MGDGYVLRVVSSEGCNRSFRFFSFLISGGPCVFRGVIV